MSPGHGPKDAFDVGPHAGPVGGTLDHGGLDPGAGDALGDVADEHLGQDVLDLAVDLAHRVAVLEEEGRMVVGVDAGRHDDVDVDGVVDAPDGLYVPAVTQGRAVDDGVDTALFDLAEGLGHGGTTSCLPPTQLRSGYSFSIWAVILTMCSCIKVGPRVSVSTSPRTVATVGMFVLSSFSRRPWAPFASPTESSRAGVRLVHIDLVVGHAGQQLVEQDTALEPGHVIADAKALTLPEGQVADDRSVPAEGVGLVRRRETLTG